MSEENFDAKTEKENAEVQAELEAYDQKHSTSYSASGGPTAFSYECEGGGIGREDLSNFPRLLALWNGANQENQWQAENNVQPVSHSQEDDDLPF